MSIQYKPTKPQKAKPAKPAKAVKAPKAEKPMKFSGTDKPMKFNSTAKPAKAPKAPKAPKAEKPIKFSGTQKVEKFSKVESSSKTAGGAMRQPVKPGVIIAVFAVIAVIIVGVLISTFFGGGVDGNVTANKIAIASLPDKTLYYVGENANYNGLKVLMTLSDGSSFTINAQDCEITGFDSSAPVENQTITVAYRDMTTTFNITIEEAPVISANKDVISVSVKTLPKTEYKVGDWMSVEGGVLLVTYDDGSAQEVAMTYDHVSGFSTAEPGTYTLTVKYVEKGLLVTTTYTITVTE